MHVHIAFRFATGTACACAVSIMLRKVGVALAPKTALDRAKKLPANKWGWRLVAPEKNAARRAILIKKFQFAGKTLALFQILSGTR